VHLQGVVGLITSYEYFKLRALLSVVSALAVQLRSRRGKTHMHPTPGGDSPTPTTDRKSLLSFVAVFALVSVLQI